MAQAHMRTAESKAVDFQTKVSFPESIVSAEDWLAKQPSDSWKAYYEENGFLKIDNILEPGLAEIYQGLYEKFLGGEINSSKHRHDLGNHIEKAKEDVENITQIMWPCDYIEGLEQGPLHDRGLVIAKTILGNDVSFDFDMLIYKAPQTNTEVPWHQDQAYWLDMPDKRAVSIWVALDNATVDNGCMWFGPGSHLKTQRPHRPAASGKHVLCCDYDEKDGTPVPLPIGSCTCHSGNTLHHTRGNTTDGPRRAYIMNFRPTAMVKWSRSQGFDHGRKGLENLDYSNAGAAYNS